MHVAELARENPQGGGDTMKRQTSKIDRIALATASIVSACGIKVAFTKRVKPRTGRRSVYRIEGIDGEHVGQEALRLKLWDLGEQLSPAVLASRLSDGDRVGPFTVRLVGIDQAGKRIVSYEEQR